MKDLKYIIISYLKNNTSGFYYTLLWNSILVYTLGYLFSVSEYMGIQFAKLIMTIGLVGILYSFYKTYKISFKFSYFFVVFFLYMVWHLFVVREAFTHFNLKLFINYLFTPYIFLPFFVPLISLIPINIFQISYLFKLLSFLGVILIVFSIIFINLVLFDNQDFSEQAVWSLGTGSGFLLMTWGYHSKRRRMIAFVVVLLSLFIASVMARRNIMLTFTNFFVISYIIFLFDSKKKFKQKIFLVVLTLILTTALYSSFFKYQDELFYKISDRFDVDSREFVYTAYFSDMTPTDLQIGKGYDGRYFCPDVDPDSDDRYLIESGYLQIILKGGIVNLVLFLLIALPAIYQGLFKSQNILSKAAGLIVFLWLIDMIPWGMPAMNIRYILLWICIGICYTDNLRNLPETKLKNALILFQK